MVVCAINVKNWPTRSYSTGSVSACIKICFPWLNQDLVLAVFPFSRCRGKLSRSVRQNLPTILSKAFEWYDLLLQGSKPLVERTGTVRHKDLSASKPVYMYVSCQGRSLWSGIMVAGLFFPFFLLFSSSFEEQKIVKDIIVTPKGSGSRIIYRASLKLASRPLNDSDGSVAWTRSGKRQLLW